MSDNTPPSQMMRVPTPLVDAVKELSRLHREGYSYAVMNGLQQLIATVDSKADSIAVATDSKSNKELIAELIARLTQVEKITSQLAPIQERVTALELGEKVARTQVKTKPQDVESPSLKALPTTLVEASGLPSSTSRTDKEQPVNELVETELGGRTEDKALAFVPNTPPMPLIVEPQDMGQNKKAPKRKKLTDKVTKRFLDDLKKNFLLSIPYSERNKVKNDIDYFASALLGNREKWINDKGVVAQEVLEQIKNGHIHASGCRDKNLVKQHFDRFLSSVQERVSALNPPDFYPVPEAVQQN